jgi:hypothetical protein
VCGELLSAFIEVEAGAADLAPFCRMHRAGVSWKNQIRPKKTRKMLHVVFFQDRTGVTCRHS